jgi:hypothetical protein
MLFGVPPAVESFFRPVVTGVAKPIRRALPIMVMAMLLAPHRRCLKTLAGMVLGRREHVATISRRLRNRHWKTHDWYTMLYEAASSVSAFPVGSPRDQGSRTHGYLPGLSDRGPPGIRKSPPLQSEPSRVA